MDEKKIYPLYAETEDGTRIPLLQYNRDPWFHRRSGTETPDHDSKSIPLNPKSRSEESDHESRSEVSDQQQQFRSEGCGQSDHPSCRHAPLLLLGGGGTGKTTALLRLACGQSGPEEYSGRNWARGIAALEWIDLRDYPAEMY